MATTTVHSTQDQQPPPALSDDTSDPDADLPRWRRRPSFQAAKLWLFLSDMVFTTAAIILAMYLGDVILEPNSPEWGDPTPAMLVCLGGTLVGLAQQRAYKARYLALRRDEFARIFRGVLIGVASTIVVGFVIDYYTPQYMLLVAITGSLALWLNREIARRVFHRLRLGGRMVRRAVVVGGNGDADELANMLTSSRELGYEVSEHVEMMAPDGSRIPWFSVLDQVQEAVVRTGAASVIVAMSATDLDTSGRLVRRLTDQGLHVELCMPLRDIDVTRLRLRPLGRFPVFYVEPVDRTGMRPAAKRVFDVVVASLALLVALPVLLVAALAIKIDSRGPVIFRQKRVGRDGREFPVLKLRTMHRDAEARLAELMAYNEAEGPVFKMRNDPRVTRVGRVLRKLSIDEAPQLWNVIRGQMSLVGPRPALPSEMEHWTADLYERLRVRPGITGMWQVSGRSDGSADDYLRLDLYYVHNWSFFMDMVLLAKTVPAVLVGRGAY